ncbi:MAG: hypothetical protein RL186_386 [Pseudomonadota bacterium]|jgi:hypothetical protein
MSRTQPNPKPDQVQIISPDYRLQRKLGGPAGDVLSPAAMQRAQAAIDNLLPQLNAEITRLFAALETAVTRHSANSRDTIWNAAHELRGLSGTAGKTGLGEAANIICMYLEGTGEASPLDKPLLAMLIEICKQANKDGADQDPMVQILLSDGTRAVTTQRKREGRAAV